MIGRLLLLLLLILLPNVVAAQPGVFISEASGCTGDTRLASPITGRTYCFDQVQNALYHWTGTWTKLTPTTIPLPASEGGTGLNTSALTGVPSLAAGTWSIGAVKPPTSGSGAGIFAPTACSAITSPVSGTSECLDTTRGVWNNYDGTRWQSDVALATGVINAKDYGAKGDGTTDDTAALTSWVAAIGASQTGPTGLGVAGASTLFGRCGYLPRGVYPYTTALALGAALTNNNNTLCVQGAGPLASVLVWKGGNNVGMIEVGRTDLGNLTNVRISGIGFYNGATSGADYAAVRALNVDGIRLNSTGATAGVNRVVIEQSGFTYLDNGIVNTTASAVNQLTVRHNVFTVYNQTNPVVNPPTDTPVAAHGNALYFASGTIAQGIYLYENDVFNQNYFLDSQGQMVNLVVQGNFVQGSQAGFVLNRSIRLASFTNIDIHGNEFETSGAGGIVLDLGTTALGSSNVSGGSVIGNYLPGTGAATQIGLRATFAEGLAVVGNTFFNLTTGITLVGANVTRPFIGQNAWTTVTTKLSDGGAVNPITLDPVVGITLPTQVTILPTTDQFVLGTGNVGIISMAAQSATHRWTFPNVTGTVITTGDTGTVTALMGGTGLSAYAVGDLIYASATTPTLARLADVAAGSYLRSGGVNTAPLWSTLILPNAATINQLVYATSANTWGASSNLTFDGTSWNVGTVGPHALGGAVQSGVQMRLTGTYASATDGLQILTRLQPDAGSVSELMQIAGTIDIAGSGVHADFRAAYFNPPTITAGVGSVTRASTVEISGPPSGAGTNYPFFIASGTNVRWGGYGAGTLTTDANGVITAVSDERLKNVEGPFRRGLAELQDIVPILYRWKPDDSGRDTAGLYAGFSAQNVLRTIPEAISADERGYLTLNDRPILGAVVNALKQLDARLRLLEGRP